eukprot:2090769-Heterocapsa_arctica.AAC.1
MTRVISTKTRHRKNDARTTETPPTKHPKTVQQLSNTVNTFKQTPEDRSTTFKNLQTPSEPCAP